MVNRAALKVVGALAIVLTIVIVYYSNRTVINPGCQGNVPCVDEWLDSGGNPLNAQRVCNLDGTIYTPNVGPGKCKNPCPTGQIPCWDGDGKRGRCVIGTTCPCFGDVDCGGSGKGTCVKNPQDESKNYCECVAPWSGAKCENDGCTTDGDCGQGACNPVTRTCECNVGWATPTNGDPCSACADDLANNNAWGPPGSCVYRRYITTQKDGYAGAMLPLPTNEANCYNADTVANSTVDKLCKDTFGDAAFFPPAHPGTSPSGVPYWCSNSNSNNACRGSGYNPSCSTNIGDFNTNQMLCWVPNGFYAPPGNDYSKYNACNVAADCTAHLPAGFKGAAK